MTAAGAWVLMTWGEFAWCLILAVLAAVLVGLVIGYRARVRAEQVPSEAAARQRALEQLAVRYPVAFTHLEDEEMAAAGIFRVPSHLLPQAADTTEGGHQ